MVGIKCIVCGKEESLLFCHLGLWQKKIRVGEATVILCKDCYGNFDTIREKVRENIFVKFIDEVKIEDS